MLYRKDEDNIDPYENNHYINDWYNTSNTFLKDVKDIEDIYSDKHISKVLAKIFWEKRDKTKNTVDFKKRHFEINLGTEKWLARIILNAQEYIEKHGWEIKEGNNTMKSLFKNILETIKKEKDPNYQIRTLAKLEVEDTKKILELLKVPYEKEWLFWDFTKLTKIFNEAHREDLITFANLAQSRTNISRVTKEWFNTKLLLNNEPPLIDQGNVFEFLSDFNSDWVVSADKSKKNKEQFEVGDVGNISGQQLLFTLEQAEKTQNALLGNGKWEGVVVKNMVKMISLMVKESKNNPEYLSNYSSLLSSFKDTFSEEYRNQINTLLTKENPTKQELVVLLKNFPQSKIFFLAAVEKVTGWSSINQADLYDVLTGQEGKRLQQIDSIKEMEELRRKLDIYIQWKPELKEFVDKYWSVELRETMLQRIMDVVDNIGLQVSFDKATKQDMIMSWVNKTFYREQAKKKILGEFNIGNIQNISIWTNLTGLKLSYQIGKSHISSDWTSKYHIAGWPSFYLWKSWIWGGIDISFSRAEQINYANVSSASLDDVQNAKYLGGEWWAGVRAGTKWIGLYAALWASYEKDPLMGIIQLEKTYHATSNRLFDISGITSFTKNSIQSHLEWNLDSLQQGIYRDFINNNINKLKENIRFVVSYLEKSGLLKEINDTYKTPKEKEDAIWSLLRIVQQGNIDQWKWDIVMNLNGKIDLTRFSAWVTAGTRFFGTKSGNDIWSSSTGNSDELWNSWLPSTTDEAGSAWWETRIWFLGVYVSSRISTWKNKYLPNSRQFLATEQEMNKGIIDHIDAGKDLDKYVLYLEWLFNKTEVTGENKKWLIIEKKWLIIEKKWLIIEKLTGKNDGKIQISYKPLSENEEEVPLHKLLNIHYLPKQWSKAWADEQFIYKDNVLIIGNVWPIAAYTTTLPGGVDRVLSLGTKSLNEATRLTWDNVPKNDIQKIEFKENGFEYFDKAGLDITIDAITMWTKPLAATEKTLYKSLFDSEGKLLSHADVTLNGWLTVWQKFSTGTIALYKKADGKYILDYQSSPDDKLIMEYKTIGTNKNTILNVSNPDLSETFTNINLPNAKDVPDIEHGKTIDFNNFIKNISSGNFDEAETSLLNIIGSNSTIGNKLKNWSAEEKQNIIDNYVSIFAYEKNYEGMTINEIFNWKIENWKTIRKWRWNLFLNYEWPGKTSFSEELKYEWPGKTSFSEELKKDLLANRKSFIEKQKNNKYETFERETPKNIFWYTAFYRSGVTDRWYGATPFGKTNIIKGSLYEIGKDKDEKEQTKLQQDGKQRIIANLEKDPRHRRLLVKQIQKAINNADISKHINEDNLAELIIKKEIKIPSTETNNPLDISSKIIKLNSDAIFYLLGECLNESVWLRIKDVEVVEELDTYKAEKTPDKKYTSNLFGRSNSVSGEIQSERDDLSITGHKKIDNIENLWKGNNWRGQNGNSDELPDGKPEGGDE